MRLQAESRVRERIQAIDFWRGPITLSPLFGGITNHNFLVKVGPCAYVARVSDPRLMLGIDRRNEVLCQRAANELGVAPAVVYEEEGILISEFLDAQTMTAEAVRHPDFIERLAGVLRTLHSGEDRLTGEMLYFSVFQTIRTYARTSRKLGVELPRDLDSQLEDARELSGRIIPFHPVLCHNDLLPSNLLDDGRRISLVDWEYAGIGHPLFDLAGVSANCAFTAELDRTFLAAYRQTATASPVDLEELHILKTMSLLREALWALIQSAISGIDFDYVKYAKECFHGYREARRNLDRNGSV